MEATIIKWSAKTITQNSSNVYSHFCVLGQRPSCYFLFSLDLFSRSNPVDLPPAHQLHVYWVAVRRRHRHSRASVCAEADVYSTSSAALCISPGHHYLLSSLWHTESRMLLGSMEWILLFCFIQFDAQITHDHPTKLNCAKWEKIGF